MRKLLYLLSVSVLVLTTYYNNFKNENAEQAKEFDDIAHMLKNCAKQII